MTKTKVELGTVQETLLLTLWARAVEATKADPILRDPKSQEILEQIDYDFSKLEEAKGTQVAVCLRGLMYDDWVKSFLQENPSGTIVEIGCGLNTRFERLDNGQVRWFDLDMPDSIAVREKYFSETERRKLIASSVLDDSWVDAVKAVGSGPIMFVAEGVLMYFTEAQVKQLLALLVKNFPGCYFVFDSMSPFMVKNQKQHDAIKLYSAKFDWGIKDIKDIEKWDNRYQVTEVKFMRDAPAKYYQRMGLFNRLIFSIPPFKNMYQLNLTKLG
ncbi:class I SAM-dependent methyltransferase [Microcoleus sp. CAWBG58]|uniref:class I SAM-dependent methyltransferase n=1 Tax=Microcoleus sp. CAWBG58 TaxID=2841651 RepID=UPI0025EBC17C|nr:class I SAM-dependent methyltransferase [Microcoleus sp. CAWBG58]